MKMSINIHGVMGVLSAMILWFVWYITKPGRMSPDEGER